MQLYPCAIKYGSEECERVQGHTHALSANTWCTLILRWCWARTFCLFFWILEYKFCVREQICLKTKWALWHGAWFSFSSSFSFFLAGAHFQIMSRREWIYTSNNFLVRQNNYALFFQNSIILWQYSKTYCVDGDVIPADATKDFHQDWLECLS